jgi:hypothetical protein
MSFKNTDDTEPVKRRDEPPVYNPSRPAKLHAVEASEIETGDALNGRRCNLGDALHACVGEFRIPGMNWKTNCYKRKRTHDVA